MGLKKPETPWSRLAGLKPPGVPGKPVPVFTAGDLPRLERACAGRAFAQRRDAALIAVFRATGIRLSELAGIRYDADDPGRSDVDLRHREITVQGKGRKTRTVKISFDAARSLNRYLRVRARHTQAYRPQLWLGVSNRGPMTASGIYQVIVRRGRQCGIDVYPYRFRHILSALFLCCDGHDEPASGTATSAPGYLFLAAAFRRTPWDGRAHP